MLIRNKISSDFFKKAILKGKDDYFNDFPTSVNEFKIGSDNFFEIIKDSDHSHINRSITKLVLEKIPVNSSACGFIEGKSYYDFLRPHIGGYFFLRLDIKNFFHSIPSYEVKKLLSIYFNDKKNDGEKYSPLDIAYISTVHKVSNFFDNKDLIGKEILPIGFPSSPVISNIIFRKIDILIQKLCEEKGIIYTRYADDMLFSSEKSKYLHSEQFEKDISIFISTLSLKLKNKKRKATENTISLNGYIIQNKKSETGIFDFIREKPVGKIRISNKKLKIQKKLKALLRRNTPPVKVMESLFGLDYRKFIRKYESNPSYYIKFADDQLQNKIKGYRSYLISLIKYDQQYDCVDKSCIDTVKELVEVFESNIK